MRNPGKNERRLTSSPRSIFLLLKRAVLKRRNTGERDRARNITAPGSYQYEHVREHEHDHKEHRALPGVTDDIWRTTTDLRYT